MLILGDSNPVRHIRRPYVNYALIALCFLAFLLDISYVDYGLFPAQFHPEETLPAQIEQVPGGMRLVTYAFLHAGLIHLLGNMVVMWVFGDNIEDAMGHLRYALFFVLCAVAGGFAEVMLTTQRDVPIVGASGAISGIMGAYLLLHPRARVLILVGFRIPVLVPASLFVGLSVGVDVVMALAGNHEEAMVAWWAHLGGFAAGMLLVLVMRYRDVPLFQPADAYPEIAFPRIRRFLILIDLSPKRPMPGARVTLSAQVLAGFKVILFFAVITIIVELFFVP